MCTTMGHLRAIPHPEPLTDSADPPTKPHPPAAPGQGVLRDWGHLPWACAACPPREGEPGERPRLGLHVALPHLPGGCQHTAGPQRLRQA